MYFYEVCQHLTHCPWSCQALFKIRIFWVKPSGMSSVRFKQSLKNRQASQMTRHLISLLFSIFIPIKWPKVQVTILCCSRWLFHFSSSLSCSNWTLTAYNYISLKVTACRGIVILGLKHLIWSHDPACCFPLSSDLCTEDNGKTSHCVHLIAFLQCIY